MLIVHYVVYNPVNIIWISIQNKFTPKMYLIPGMNCWLGQILEL